MNDDAFYTTTRSHWRRRLAQVAASGACVALAACQTNAAVGARPGVSPGVVLGRVKANADHTSLVVVAIDRDTGRVAQRAFLTHSSYYALPMSAGHYKLYAFADLDRNGLRGVDEPSSLMFSMADDVHSGERIELPTMNLRP
jgi:hypothetical protein